MTSRILLTVLLCTFAGVAKSAEWYVGGNLHRADAKAWRAASYHNRLATSSDIAAAIKGASSMSELRHSAEDMEKCISEAVADPSTNVEVSQVGALCAILMGWGKE